MVDPAAEIGVSGLQQFGGVVQEEELQQLLDPRNRYKTFREMADNSAVIGGVLLLLDLLVRQVKWDVEPSEDAPTNDPRVEFVDSCFADFTDTDWRDVVGEILSFLVYGWSYHETVYKRRSGEQPDTTIDESGNVVEQEPSSNFNDGRLGWHRLAGRAQETLWGWVFDSHERMVAMVQVAPPDFRRRVIPLSNALHFRMGSRSSNPEGRSLLRSAYRSWYFHKRYEEIAAIGIDRDLAGTPMLGVPGEYMKASGNLPSNLATERAQWQKLIRNIKRGSKEGIMYPLVYDARGNQKFKLELLTTGGRRQFDIKAMMEYYDQRMALSALSDVILLGHEKVGSFALADSKTNTTGMFGGVLLDIITGQMNRRAIPRLLRINGMPTENAPRLVHGDMESLSLKEIAEYVQTLSGSGLIIPTPELEAHLLREGNLPGGSDDL